MRVSQAAQAETHNFLEQMDKAVSHDIASFAVKQKLININARAKLSKEEKLETKQLQKEYKQAKKQAKAEHVKATKAAKKAYTYTRFSEANKMGFLRLVMICFTLHIVFTLIGLVFTSRNFISYDSSNVVELIDVILEGVCLWMFLMRFRAVRFWIIGTSVFNIACGLAVTLASGTFHLFAFIFSSSFDIFLILYFLFSRRVRITLTNKLTLKKEEMPRDNFIINRRGWAFIRNLIIYYCVFSVVGHWMEMGMCQFIIMGWVEGEYDPTNTMLWRDWLYPFPMEGLAVVLIALLLYPLKEWLVKKISHPVIPYIISFVANALTCGLIEFTMGLFVNADLQLWDYTNNFCNIMGQVCLQNVLAFGVAASIIAWIVYPLMERTLARIPKDIMNIVFVLIFVGYGILQTLYLIDPPNYNDNTLASYDTVLESQAEEMEEDADKESFD